MKNWCQIVTSAAIAAACLAGAATGSAAADKKYTIYLSNNFVGNDWRQQMLRSADVAVKKPPLAGRVDLKVEVVDTTIQAQINSLNNIIRSKPDAILIDAGSAEALNPTIQKACDAGILVIAFDQIVTADCAYTMESDWGRAPQVEAEWIVKKLGGKGEIFVDRGLAGAPISAQLENGFEGVIKKYPDIKITGYFNGNYALGPEQEGVASLLAAHPKVDAIFVQGYGAGAIKALQDAGRPIVPVTGSPFNQTTTRLSANARRTMHSGAQSGLSLRRSTEAGGRDSRWQEACGEARSAPQRVPHHRSAAFRVVPGRHHDQDRGRQECFPRYASGPLPAGQPGLA